MKTPGGRTQTAINNIYYIDQSSRIGLITIVQHTSQTHVMLTRFTKYSPFQTAPPPQETSKPTYGLTSRSSRTRPTSATTSKSSATCSTLRLVSCARSSTSSLLLSFRIRSCRLFGTRLRGRRRRVGRLLCGRDGCCFHRKSTLSSFCLEIAASYG